MKTTSDTYVEKMKAYFASNSKQKEYVGHTSKVHTIGWNADGRRLASGSYDRCVTIFAFDTAKETLVCILNNLYNKGHYYMVIIKVL